MTLTRFEWILLTILVLASVLLALFFGYLICRFEYAKIDRNQPWRFVDEVNVNSRKLSSPAK
jgi:hypothetical protein